MAIERGEAAGSVVTGSWRSRRGPQREDRGARERVAGGSQVGGVPLAAEVAAGDWSARAICGIAALRRLRNESRDLRRDATDGWPVRGVDGNDAVSRLDARERRSRTR
jgi:hypothetical protein